MVSLIAGLKWEGIGLRLQRPLSISDACIIERQHGFRVMVKI